MELGNCSFEFYNLNSFIVKQEAQRAEGPVKSRIQTHKAWNIANKKSQKSTFYVFYLFLQITRLFNQNLAR